MSRFSYNQTSALCATVLLLLCDDDDDDDDDGAKKAKKRKRVWMKEKSENNSTSSRVNLLQNPQVQEAADYKTLLRMNDDNFHELLELIRPKIEKKSTLMRETISAEKRLIATLRYLGTGQRYEELKVNTAMSPQLLGKVIPETCRAIYNVLRHKFLRLPSSQEGWKTVSKQFEETCQFNNCLGALGGSHVLIKKPPDSGSFYYNYKGSFSLIIMAIANANHEFLYIHTGTNGKMSGGNVLKNSNFYWLLKSGSLNLPDPVYMNEINKTVPYAFVTNEAFCLLPNIIKPYLHKNLTMEQHVLNCKLKRAYQVVETAFDIMANRFRVLLTPIAVDVNNVDIIVLACTALHNFLMKKSPGYFQPAVDFCNTQVQEGTEGTSKPIRDRMLRLKGKRQATTLHAMAMREKYRKINNIIKM